MEPSADHLDRSGRQTGSGSVLRAGAASSLGTRPFTWVVGWWPGAERSAASRTASSRGKASGEQRVSALRSPCGVALLSPRRPTCQARGVSDVIIRVIWGGLVLKAE